MFLDNYLFSGDAFISGFDVVTTVTKADKLLALENYNILKQLSARYVVCPGHRKVDQGSICFCTSEIIDVADITKKAGQPKCQREILYMSPLPKVVFVNNSTNS